MPLSVLTLSTALALAASVSAHPGHHAPIARRLAQGDPTPKGRETWYHDEDAPIHKLFRRGPATDGIQYATVGSPEWTSAYPPDIPTTMPQAWTNALNAAVSAGKIPNVPVTTLVNDNPTYPQGVDGTKMPICSTYQKCLLPGTIWDAPDGVVGVSFDDGPVAGSSDTLYAFLQQNNIAATHFMIGKAILAAPNQFNIAYNMGGDIAVHTWTHRHMTTLTNEEVAMELGWTMELIHNSTGGRLPRFWRPPTGDADARVVAIAKEVFGLETVIWNHDTEDWSMATTDLTLQEVEGSLTQWYSGAKSPGLIILEHELTNNTVAGFIDTYPIAIKNGWKTISVAQLNSTLTPYQNADGSTGAVTPVNDVLAADVPTPVSSSSAAASVTAGSGASPAPSGSSNIAVTSSGSAPRQSTTASPNTSGARSSLPLTLGGLFAIAISGVAVIVL